MHLDRTLHVEGRRYQYLTVKGGRAVWVYDLLGYGGSFMAHRDKYLTARIRRWVRYTKTRGRLRLDQGLLTVTCDPKNTRHFPEYFKQIRVDSP